MKLWGLIVAGLAAIVAAAVPLKAAPGHVHYCDCGHPQGKIACGELLSTETSHREEAKQERPTHRLVTIQAAPGSEAGGGSDMNDLMADQIPDEVRSSVKLGVLAVLLPCLLALGVMGVGLISRRK